MSRKLSVIWILFLVITLSGNYTRTTAQSATDNDAAQQLAIDTQNSATIWQNSAANPVKFITIPPQHAVPKPRSLATDANDEQVARAFLGSYGQIVGVRSQQTELTLLKQERTANADGFVRFQQVYRTIPVMAGELNVHINQQRNVTSVNGEILPNISINTTPTIDSDTASTIARNYIAKQYGVVASTLSATKSTLWIYNPQLLGGPGAQITTLNWRTEVRGQHGAEPFRELVLVNANNGIVTLHFNQIAHALNQRVCNSTSMDTDYDPNNNCNTDAKATRLNSTTPSSITDVNLAWEYTKATYDFFYTVLGRDSIDNKGMRLISLVNYCPKDEVCPFENAYWNGTQMTYGAGFASADDVVGHELTHGVTERTASLFYYFQSGAINESMSDVFGELIDQSYAGSSTDNGSVKWELGEDLTIGAIRSMSTPADFQQPDKMTDTSYYVNYATPDYASYGGYNDSGGVHTNSGVNNKAAYLMVDGDTFNGQTITGIGITKVAQLYYRVLTTYLTSGSDYYDLGVALNTACSDLVNLGIASMSSADCTQVANAVTATEMLTTPTNAPATDAVLCSAGQTPANVWSDNFEVATSGNWVAQKPKVVWYNPGSLDTFGNGKYATSGVGNLWGYDIYATTDSSINMAKNVTIPAGAFLTFKHSYEFESSNYISPTATFYDGGVLEYSINNSTTWNDAGSLITTNGYNGQLTSLGIAPGVSSTNVLKGKNAFVGASSGYISSKVNLSTLAGSPVRFRFRIGADISGDNYGWYIDDVRIYKCLSDTTTAKTTAVGTDHSCTITNDGNAWCWGRNRFGQLGDNSVSAKSLRASLVGKPSLTSYTAIAPGLTHTCARTSDGSAWCWGDNNSGQLGNNTTTSSTGGVQVTTDNSGTFLTNVSTVSVGNNASCALKSNGTVWCWGDNSEGQLGDGTSDSSSFAVQVKKADTTPLINVTAISVGTDHACAVLSDKSAWCWGDNSDGATGAGTTAANIGAVRVTKAANAAFTNVVAISAGLAHTCALLGDKTVWCWGLNTYGQLGNGTTTTSLVAVSTGLANITMLGQSTGNHTCAVSATNILSCWGANTSGQLGDGTTAAKTRAVALKTAYATTTGTITSVSSGGKQTCLTNTMGEVWCWGRNSNGQLGSNSTTNSLAPVKVSNTSGVLFGN